MYLIQGYEIYAILKILFFPILVKLVVIVLVLINKNNLDYSSNTKWKICFEKSTHVNLQEFWN